MNSRWKYVIDRQQMVGVLIIWITEIDETLQSGHLYRLYEGSWISTKRISYNQEGTGKGEVEYISQKKKIGSSQRTVGKNILLN